MNSPRCDDRPFDALDALRAAATRPLLAVLALAAALSLPLAAHAAAPASGAASASPAAAAARPAPKSKPDAAPIVVSNAYSHATPPGAAVGAAFLEIRSTVDDRLMDAKSPVARRAEVHSTTMDGGVMRMRRAGPIAVKAGVPLLLEPGELHLMLYGLEKPLVAGQRIPLELRFEKSGVVRAEAIVRGDDAAHP
jgi:copper(I)-binding protein